MPSTGEPKDRPFNSFRVAASEQACQLVREVCEVVQMYERHRQPRKRARKIKDKTIFERQVEAVVCDLAHRMITKPDGWIAVSFSNDRLGKADRYRSSAVTKKLRDVILSMAAPELEFAEYIKGFQNPFKPNDSRQTVMRAGARLRKSIAELRLTTVDFDLEKTQEIILLKSDKEGHFDKGQRIQYFDTPQTIAYREELRRINDHIEQADIEYVPLNATEKCVDTTDRLLRRHFNNRSFEQGGRLFGGFWQPMKKQDRHGIVIEGMDTVTLDYGQMLPRILYGLSGLKPHFDDAYLIPGLENYRDGVKMVFNAMIHSDKPHKRKPRDTAPFLPDDHSIADLTEMIKAFHAPVFDSFYAGKGMYLSYQESRVLITVLLRLIDQDITALPIHDAVIVAEDKAEQTEQIMLQVFKDLIGIDALVRVE
jgi:hypothetical protein